MTTILGIDESGRGSVIGPLVVAGVMIDEKDHEKLREMGVKDSKLLTPKKREELEPKIKKLAKDYVVIKITAYQIDELMKIKNLNIIEAERMAEIVKILGPDKAYIDAPQVSTDKFKALVKSLAKNHTELICENYADLNYPVCAAGSILAKVERDREVERIKGIVGFDFGVGYSHDERSIKFVKKALKENKHTEFLRHSWITVAEAKKEMAQKSLKQF